MEQKERILEEVINKINNQNSDEKLNWEKIKNDIQSNVYGNLTDEEKEYLYITLPKSLGLN